MRMMRAGHIDRSCLSEMINAVKIVIRKHNGKNHLRDIDVDGRNIKINLKESEYEGLMKLFD
jgi:hypothetical protein